MSSLFERLLLDIRYGRSALVVALANVALLGAAACAVTFGAAFGAGMGVFLRDYIVLLIVHS